MTELYADHTRHGNKPEGHAVAGKFAAIIKLSVLKGGGKVLFHDLFSEIRQIQGGLVGIVRAAGELGYRQILDRGLPGMTVFAFIHGIEVPAQWKRA